MVVGTRPGRRGFLTCVSFLSFPLLFGDNINLQRRSEHFDLNQHFFLSRSQSSLGTYALQADERQR